jgi:hypothetical protein
MKVEGFPSSLSFSNIGNFLANLLKKLRIDPLEKLQNRQISIKFMINNKLILLSSKFLIGFIWLFLKQADDSIDFCKKFGGKMIFWVAIK